MSIFNRKHRRADKLEYIYKNYSRLMFTVAYKMVQNADIAEDMVQESLLKIMRHFDKVECEDVYSAKLRNMIMVIVRNTCINYLKRTSIIEFSQLDEMDDELADTTVDVENLIISDETVEFISKTIDLLDYKYSSVLILKFFSDFSYFQIAEVLEITQDTARARVHRGRQMLIKQLMNGGVEIEKQ